MFQGQQSGPSLMPCSSSCVATMVPALPLVVTINRRMKDLGNCCGSRIELRADLQPEDMLTTCVHEVIHALYQLPGGQEVKCTTTLCSKIRPTCSGSPTSCSRDLQACGVYRTYQDHYPPKGEDFYDSDEDTPTGAVTNMGGN